MARSITREDGIAAVREWTTTRPKAQRSVVATAVRWTLQTLAADAPGRAVEVRVPPWGAIQCIPGPQHSRGTPANVVETNPETWLALAVGEVTWEEALAAGDIAASGTRADISHWLPLLRVNK